MLREFYVPYEILIKCHIFSDNEFVFKKCLIKATQQDFDIFNSLISNINIFDEKVPEKTLLVNLFHIMIGLQRILYVKFLTTKQPRTQVNKYHAEVLTHKGGTLLMHGNKLVPYIVQNNRFYVPLIYAYQSLSQAKRGARAPRQYEIDYLNLLFIYFAIDSPALTSDTLLVDAFSIKSSDLQAPIHFRTLNEHQLYERNKLLNTIMRNTQINNKLPMKTQQQPVTNSSTHKSNKCPPANVVVNPLIHHPSFYGLPSSNSPVKQTAPPSSISVSSPSNSVVVNPLLLPASTSPDTPTKKCLIKVVKYDNHSLNALMESPNQSLSDSKISIKQIFDQFSFDIDYEKFIRWCQNNLLLPLIKLDEEEKGMLDDQNHSEDYYVYYRHLNRCIELLNDLKRGTISMTLLPTSNPETNPMKSQLAGNFHFLHLYSTSNDKNLCIGAKKRKTTIPTTRHMPSSSSVLAESTSTVPDNSPPSPEFFTHEESIPPNDDIMPVVDTVEEEQPIQLSEMNSSFLIVESNEGDDGKIHLDDTLPSCSSGYESAAALTNIDPHTATNASSDDDDDDGTNSTARSREHSSSCPSEHSLVPIVSNSIEQEKTLLPPVIPNQNLRQRERNRKSRVRSRSPTPRNSKKIRSSDEQDSSSNTITSDQIEQHLRTLLMPNINEQRRTRTRPIKTPTRLVEEIPSIKPTELGTNMFDAFSTSSTDPNSNEPSVNYHPSCTYNVTISTKPNKLGFTIKKVVQR